MKIVLLKMECLTNMHVGSGEMNYSVIDNEVVKDPVLEGVPVIPPSGVKGSFRNYFMQNKLSDIDKIFGMVTTKDGIANETIPGSYKFMGGNLLVRPMRVSEGKVSYIRTTSIDILNNMVDLFRNLGIERVEGCKIPGKLSCDVNDEMVYISNSKLVIKVEGMETRSLDVLADNMEEWKRFMNIFTEEPFAIMSSVTFKEQDLPVIARNKLDEKGISQNLWYEEVVPHKSIFYLPILTQEELPGFVDKVDRQLIQFGGNASIGYGLTKISHLKITMQ